jgi:phosphoglycolate phosphatase
MIENGLRLEGRAVSDAVTERLFAEFIEHYAEHLADRSRPFPGVEAALDRLAERGCRLAVCTNKLEDLSKLLLGRLGLAHRFDAICGQDTFGIQKPNPDVLRRTISAVGGDPLQAVMVGDSGTDIATARNAGIPVVAVDFGYSETPVEKLGPDRLIGHFDQLWAAVMDLAPAAAIPQKPF